LQRLALGLALLALWGKPASAQDVQASDIQKVVNMCVEFVHRSPVPPAVSRLYGPEMSSLFFRNFDAFYNPASGLVQNNATTVGSQPSLFVFQKCMAEHGLPLR
jgi:hypothetical protein